jgi:Zn finger protein HypA/HybF involved in hydrogenase expression
MVKCQKCGKEKKDAATYCPECQATIRQRIIWGTILILVFILILIAILRINTLYG